MNTTLRERLYEIIFEHETWEGRAFDVVLLWSILISVAAVVLESVSGIRTAHGDLLRAAEWFFTALFTLEYILRLVAVPRAWQYASSLFGIVDLVAILPTFLNVLIPGSHSLLIIRALRLLRVFRVLKLGHHMTAARVLAQALRASKQKITVFISVVLTMVLVVGTLMYLIEGEENGFTSIPIGVYWAIVTMTTVGYGDISPHTVPGQILASVVMILGYGVIAVPTGIVTSELTMLSRAAAHRVCPRCQREGHDGDAAHCKYCAAPLGTGPT